MRSRRALSTVIGTVFFTAVIISALSYVSYSINTIGNFSESVIVEDSRQRDKDSERFDIMSVVLTPANKLNINIKNTGNIPITFSTLWIEDQDSSSGVLRFDLEEIVSPGSSLEIGNGLSFTADPATSYNMKLVTSRGNSQTFFVNSGTTENLLIQMHAVPSTIPTGFSTKILLYVMNNMSNNSVLYNIQPQIQASFDPSVSIVGSAPSPASHASLKSGDVAIFEYEYTITGDKDEQVVFTGNILNGNPGNTATTTVTIKEVQLAVQAGNALTSFGLDTDVTAKTDTLFFHDETSLTPNGIYRMDGSDPNGSGSTLSPYDTILEFISTSLTEEITISQGNYNARLNYYSDLTPVGIPSPSLAYLFTCDNCGGSDYTVESTGNISNAFLDKDNSNTPIWVSSGGPHNDAYYQFTSDYMSDTWDVNHSSNSPYSEPTDAPDSTAVWIRIPNVGTDNYMSVIRFGDEGVNEDEYEISIGDNTSGNRGKVVFHYAVANDSSETTCVGNSRIDDNTWYYIVAVRPSDDTCTLYINGQKQTDEDVSSNTHPGNTVDVDYFAVGYDGRNSSSRLTGDIALVMHWNNDVLTQQQVTTLYNTNYGSSATKLHFAIETTDNNGNVIETISDNSGYALSFHDPAARSTSSQVYTLATQDSTDLKYSYMNYTTSVGSKVLSIGERLKFTIDWESIDENIPIYIRVDDNSFTFPEGPSYLQTPTPSVKWPTYISIDRDNGPIYYVYNEGDAGVWFTSQGTRFVLTTNDDIASYGAIIRSVNGTDVNFETDSVYIPSNNYAEIEFWQLANPPSSTPPGPTIVPAGSYQAAIYLSGYDENGEAFLRSINLGTIQITN